MPVLQAYMSSELGGRSLGAEEGHSRVCCCQQQLWTGMVGHGHAQARPVHSHHVGITHSAEVGGPHGHCCCSHQEKQGHHLVAVLLALHPFTIRTVLSVSDP